VKEGAMNATITTSLDLKGLSCPIPVIRTAKVVKILAPGEAVEVLTTDPGSVPDFRAWSKATGNPLLESGEEGGVFRFVIQRKEA
jgi:tRNA 2-thiouridine synthesizing protein A